MDQLSKEKIEQLKGEIDLSIKDINIEKMNSRLGELETRSMEEDFWKNQVDAKKVMSEISSIKEDVATIQKLSDTVNSLLEIFEELPEKDRITLEPEYEKLVKEFNDFQKFKFLSGKYDKNNAILSLHSGQGGTEANDWTAMLLRMYTRFFEKKGWKAEISHMVEGTETGISTVTLLVEGKYAFGLLKYEKGTHRLVRNSPFNAQGLRQTSFAGVEVMPEIDDSEDDIIIPESELEFKAVRSSGPGGQKVNKTSSAVQIKHIPTGLTVHSSEQRSQSQNRETAMRILKAKLWQLEEDKRQEELNKIKGEHKVAGWGNQIRNYVLQPYKLVKDLRTDVESTNPDQILDGDLDQFIEAEIRLGTN